MGGARRARERTGSEGVPRGVEARRRQRWSGRTESGWPHGLSIKSFTKELCTLRAKENNGQEQEGAAAAFDPPGRHGGLAAAWRGPWQQGP